MGKEVRNADRHSNRKKQTKERKVRKKKGKGEGECGRGGNRETERDSGQIRKWEEAV